MLAFVEVRTRTVRDGVPAQPEQSVNSAKQGMLVRTSHRFLGDRHIGDCPTRFDVLAIANVPGRKPAVRLHKDRR
jgi:Holliday junction resolvase-like predicted endonuclease